jgi:tripartite-type tricarboxylate transporter receptor subunit TctC
MQIARRHFLRLASGFAVLPLAPYPARAQAYPTHPVRLIVGFPAGGQVDIIARIVGQALGDRIGQSVVVENRPAATLALRR